ncbi:RagB/SusD family nutrient uptake outer membrane protein [Chitinophaga sp. GCM10012297]|uniref:RagB/SusD family nutrient uptake outer membrane protein n=1 Tax=Chitinophaga chungangae TaxID=2821488 RepID=A0ABS3YFZ6_9BACT|nr:RagB/SusD family nutrient uptake outer membrane protein [Chitinophaga chungangae]MBO9153600.1 RagB/SusD family nutrient uptake outer membrane protein [Chitinophaga chungangae]
MKYKFFAIPMIAATLALGGCSKFLEEKSQSDVIPKTVVDFRELLLGSGYPGKTNPAAMVYLMDDDVDLNCESGVSSGYPIVGTDPVKEDYLLYTWQPRQAEENGLGIRIGDQAGSTAYFKVYERIKGCNAVLDYVDDAIGTREEKDRVKAEALAVRAFHYFTLVNLYGDPYNQNPTGPGVPLKMTSSVEADSPARNTVAEVYDAIVKDLDEAARLMDPLPIVRKDFHINQPAIHILLSRVYLHMEKWEDCVAEADKAFALGATVPDLTNITAGRWISYDNAEVEWMTGSTYQEYNQTDYAPSRQFMASFGADDVRGKFGFSRPSNSENSPLLTKFLTNGTEAISQAVRASEAMMNRAEAYVQLNKLGDALKDLNAMRRRRIIGYADVSIGDKAVLLAEVREERRKEFCYEGFRWFDLRRYGRPSITHRYQHEPTEQILQYTLKEKDPAYTLPFPSSLLLRNPKLTQNPSASIPNRVGQ